MFRRRRTVVPVVRRDGLKAQAEVTLIGKFTVERASFGLVRLCNQATGESRTYQTGQDVEITLTTTWTYP